MRMRLLILADVLELFDTFTFLFDYIPLIISIINPLCDVYKIYSINVKRRLSLQVQSCSSRR